MARLIMVTKKSTGKPERYLQKDIGVRLKKLTKKFKYLSVLSVISVAFNIWCVCHYHIFNN